jgi:glucose-6-phosphate isomerase
MLQFDASATLAKLLTPSFGIPEQELTALRTGMKRYVEEWLAERERGEHAWSMDPYDRRMATRVQEAALRLKARKPRTIVWLGIGGSSLGPKVLQEALAGPEDPELLIIDTIDPAILEELCRETDWRTTSVIVASKSGETLEPMSAFALVWEQLTLAHRGKAAEHVLALTDPEHGTLHDFCLDHGISMLPIPPAVGGRFSIFSPIGLLPLALMDRDVAKFTKGARAMDDLCQRTALADNPAALLAATQYLLDTKRGYRLRVIMPYGQRLAGIARWNQQLVAESLGKTELQNPIPIAAVGTQDQHSLLQQWMAGPRLAWHLFIRELEKPRVYVPHDVVANFSYLAGKTFGQLLDACYEGTAGALTSAKRPHATISIQRLDEEHLAQIFFLLMTEVALLGKLYRIPVYGQPAVEVGKEITKGLLARGREEEK